MAKSNVTVVIPAYNAETYIERAIQCCLDQLETEVEIVVVDDGSTDKTASIVETLAKNCPSIHLIRHEINQGRLEARRSGIQAVDTEFVLFLDADDELRLDMAKRLLEAQNGQFDIVQCSFEIRYVNFVTEEDRRFTKNFCQAPLTVATGDDITHLVFLDRQTTWSLCGKLMRTSIVQEAFSSIASSELTQAEDAAIFFIVSCLSESYKGLGDYAGYIYNIDLGGSDARWKSMNLDQFLFSCRYIDAMELIKDFLIKTDRFESFKDDYETVRREHARSIADKLMHSVQPQLKQQAFDVFTASWPVEEVIVALSEIDWEQGADCVEALGESQMLQCGARPIKTIGIYNYAMGIGGAERVCAELVNIWHTAGYQIVFFCDEPKQACCYELPADIIWIELPKTDDIQQGTYAKRAQVISWAIETYHVDVLVHNQWWNKLLPWDMLLFKALNVPVCLFFHSIFIVLFDEGRPHELDTARILRYVDGIVVLSDTDRYFWQSFNQRVWKTNNPLTFLPEENNRASFREKNILWVGRLTYYDKQPQDALEIMARVVANDPECILTIVGGGPEGWEQKTLEKQAKALGIQQNVIFAGEQKNLAPYYQSGAVQLITSRYDGWNLVLAEAKSFGLPSVVYAMDYLTLTKDGTGVISVAQGDYDEAAKAIVELLSNKTLQHDLGQKAFEHAQELKDFDFTQFWNNIFAEIGKGSPRRIGFKNLDEQWDLIISGIKDGFRKAGDPTLFAFMKKKGIKLARRLRNTVRSLR